ncbi:MAG: LytTR family DNA-binding domain-containing protein [Oscillospiraceae bacterium]|nr:LytTR family DNA-binding domain-containing protein [Oscillospiraceae bacterium]
MRVAVCDDEGVLRAQLREVIDASGVLPGDAVIAEFSSGSALLNSHRERPFDIIFLDIQMEGLSGLETGQEIRKIDRDAIIIFLTSHGQYVFQSFQVEAFDYIVKPADAQKVSEVLSRALEKHRGRHHMIECKWEDITCALDVSEIVYLEASLRHVVFVTKSKKYECAGKIGEYEERLSPYGFFRCNHGTLINMHYIKRIKDTRIFTIYGQHVDMSVRKKRDCLKAFNAFLAKYGV